MGLIRPAALAALAVLAATTAAHADVTGKLSVTGTAGKPPVRGKAFLARTENPYTGGKTVDPMPYLVIVLDGTGIQLPPPPQVRWRLLGESFERPLLPVVAGTEVLIANDAKAKRAPSLYVEGKDLLTATPLNPRSERSFKAGEPLALHVIKDQDSPSLTGSVLVLPTPYFATPDKTGKWSIPDVPDGTYKMKVWYRNGWVEGAEADITVKDGKASKDLTLPPGLKVVAP